MIGWTNEAFIGRDRLLGFLDAEMAELLKSQMALLGVDPGELADSEVTNSRGETVGALRIA